MKTNSHVVFVPMNVFIQFGACKVDNFAHTDLNKRCIQEQIANLPNKSGFAGVIDSNRN